MYPFENLMKRTLFLSLAALLGSSASGAILIYTASLSGLNESPPNASPGTGLATVFYDDVAHFLSVDVDFSDLLGTTTAAHIHCCVDQPGNVGIAVYPGTFPGFPAGVTAGSYTSPTPLDLTLNHLYGKFLPTSGRSRRGRRSWSPPRSWPRLLQHPHHLCPGGEIRGFPARP
jgi:hypothetical protein